MLVIVMTQLHDECYLIEFISDTTVFIPAFVYKKESLNNEIVSLSRFCLFVYVFVCLLVWFGFCFVFSFFNWTG